MRVLNSTAENLTGRSDFDLDVLGLFVHSTLHSSFDVAAENAANTAGYDDCTTPTPRNTRRTIHPKCSEATNKTKKIHIKKKKGQSATGLAHVVFESSSTCSNAKNAHRDGL